MRKWIVLAFAFLSVTPSHAGGPLEMRPLPSPGAKPQIIGGRVSDPAEWPATFIFGKAEEKFCTSTAIGPRAILTAAHCVDDGQEGTIFLPGGKSAGLKCSVHEAFTPCWPTAGQPDSVCPAGKSFSDDYALCLASADLELPVYESLLTSPGIINRGEEVLLTGFGCNQSGGSDGGFGVLFEGETTVTKLPSQQTTLPRRNYVETSGGAAACYGDSGGASYAFLDPNKRVRAVFGVNSRGTMQEGGWSLLSVTFTSDFVDWAQRWSHDKAAAICGLPESAAAP